MNENKNKYSGPNNHENVWTRYIMQVYWTLTTVKENPLFWLL